MPAAVERLEVPGADLPAVRGFVHRPPLPLGEGLVLTHGAGGDCQAPILVELAGRFAEDGFVVIRCDLPYRQARRRGPPARGGAARDRQGLRHAAQIAGELVGGRVSLGGLSYGGRQASMLVADDPGLVGALLLLSYPLHPPMQPQRSRTEHFPRLQRPTLFVHGDHDPFGSLEELDRARALIPAKTDVLVVRPAGHDLGYARAAGGVQPALSSRVVAAFRSLLA
ncbi:MAG TPA: alpha/beta family hydrolase [Methylomirabilota bacterium]|nr:alpha/beta family hydrolase [Methylomirabilota bacterium]